MSIDCGRHVAIHTYIKSSRCTPNGRTKVPVVYMSAQGQIHRAKPVSWLFLICHKNKELADSLDLFKN